MMHAPNTWLSAVFGLMTSPQSCTATMRFMLHDAGFGVHGHVGHLHARHAARVETFRRRRRGRSRPSRKSLRTPILAQACFQRQALRRDRPSRECVPPTASS